MDSSKTPQKHEKNQVFIENWLCDPLSILAKSINKMYNKNEAKSQFPNLSTFSSTYNNMPTCTNFLCSFT